MTISPEHMAIIVTAIASVGAYYAKKAAASSETIRVEINSRMTELIKTSVAEALAKGKVEGIAQQKAETAVKAENVQSMESRIIEALPKASSIAPIPVEIVKLPETETPTNQGNKG